MAVVAAVILIDQATKSWAQEALRSGPVPVVGPLRLELFYNSGFAFSLGAGHPLVVGIASLLIAGGLGVYALRARTLLAQVAASMVVGGALSNLCDRIFRDNHGAVIDFISLPFWPVFNLADTAITVGALLLALAGLRESR